MKRLVSPLSSLVRAASLAALLAVLGSGVGTAAAAPPTGAAVLALASRAAPAPAWAQATYLEVPSEGLPARRLLRLSTSPEGFVREDREDLGPQGALATEIWGPPGRSAPGIAAITEAPGWIQLLAGRRVEAVVADLGIDPKRTALSRDDATVLVVLGAGPAERDRPQLHVERDSGRVRRVTERVRPPSLDGVTLEGDSPLSVELRGSAGADAPRAAWPERLVIVTLEGVTTFALQDLRVGAPLDPALFAPPALPAVAPSSPAP